MSIIQQLREKYAAWGIGAIALSLIAFVLMDARGRNDSGGGSLTDAIGKVNGENISYEQFLKKVKQTEQLYEMNNRPVDENTRQQINADTWRTLVENSLLTQELDKLGIRITPKEFNDMLFGSNPPDFLKQEFTNKETGEYDAAAAMQALSQLKKNKSNPQKEMVETFYLNPLMETSLKKKYTNLLQNSAYVPKWMAEKSVADNNSIASFGYVTVPYSTIADSTVKVTDEQISEYVNARKSQFKQEDPTRTISYVSFPFPPSGADSAEALRSLEAFKEEFKTVPDSLAGDFVTRNNSAMAFYDGFNSKSKIQIAQKDTIIATGKGNVYGPYLDGGSYVLSRVVDVKTLPDSVKAKHILVGTVDPRTQQPKLSDSAAKVKIDSIEALVKSGANFELLAIQTSDDEGSKIKGGDLGFFAAGAMVKEFNDYCLNGKVGDMSIVKTQFGYHLIKIVDQKNFEPAYKIAYMGKTIDASQATITEALNKASLFAGNSRSMKAFDENISKENLKKDSALDIKENDYNIPGIGISRKLVREIFEKDLGEVLDPEEIDGKYVVIAVKSAQPAGVLSIAKARPQVESIIRNQEKAKQLSAKIGKPASLEAVAQAQNVMVGRADSVSFPSPMIKDAGYEPKVAGFAFGKANLNKISPVIAGNSGVYVIKPELIEARGDLNANVDDTQNSMISQQKSAAAYTSTQALKAAAKIVDKRSKFL